MATASDLIPGKIFIGGIAPMTTRESIKKYFGKYGEIVDSVLMQDRLTGKSRGFGFVTFKNPNLIKKVLADTHSIDGKRVECKQALPADQKLDNQDDLSNQTTKIFVGGIPQTTTESSFKKYFEQFGKIEESFIMVDRATSKSRGFGFVTFTTVGAVERVIDNYDDNFLDGKWVECKKAFPKDVNSLSNSNYSSPQKHKGTPAKKYSEKLETSSADRKKSGTPEKRELAIDEKDTNETNTPEISSRKESEVGSPVIQPTKTLDKAIDSEARENKQLTLEAGYRDNAYWKDIIQSNEADNETTSEKIHVNLGQKLKMEGENDEEGNGYESGEDSQQVINTHFILDQIDDAANKGEPLFTKFGVREQEEYAEENPKPRRTSILFGVDLLDMDDAEMIYQGTNMNYFANLPGNCSKHIFFPAAHKHAGSYLDSDIFNRNSCIGYRGHEETRFVKNLQSLWARDTHFGL